MDWRLGFLGSIVRWGWAGERLKSSGEGLGEIGKWGGERGFLS